MEPMKPMTPMEPMKPLDFGPPWWPQELGQPNSSGGQNDIHYAFFGRSRRLAIRKNGDVTLYESGDHDISGVSQQQGHTHSLVFTSQHGTVNIGALKRA